ALELEGEEDLGEAADERDHAHVDHEQNRLLPERAGDPERQQDLDDPRRELEPPAVEGRLRDAGGGDVADGLDCAFWFAVARTRAAHSSSIFVVNPGRYCSTRNVGGATRRPYGRAASGESGASLHFCLGRAQSITHARAEFRS